MNIQTDKNIGQAWQEAVQAEVKTRPWLAALLLQKGSGLFDRFVYFYGRLTAVGQRTKRQMAMGLGTAALALALSQTPAHAATITVGAGCTLVQAIVSANTDAVAPGSSCTAGSGPDTIVLAGGTYSYTTAFALNTALPSITSPITIEGNGATIQRTGLANIRLLRVNTGGNLTLNQATITGGLRSELVDNAGGGIYNDNGTLTLNNSTVSGNSARYGGGISTVNGTTTINNSTISNNFANTAGGVESYNNSTTTLNNSTISQNLANNEGGGIANSGNSTTNLVRTIISGNMSSIGAEGWMNSNAINGNNHNVLGHSGLTNAEAFAGFNPSGSDVNATSDGGGTPTALTNILNTTLANNGGPTLTHALVSGSPAIDIAPTSSAGLIDQRGAARDFDGNGSASANEADAGAVEYRAPVQNCALSTGSDIAVNGVTFNFASLGTLSCVTVEQMGANHLLATGLPGNAGIHTSNWWHVSGNVNSGFNARVTLPHAVTPDSNAKVCKFPGTQGGFGWDCFRTGSTGGTVWLDGVTSFSDWAVGNRVGPTAVSSLTQQTTPATTHALPTLLTTLLATLTSAWLWVRRRVR